MRTTLDIDPDVLGAAKEIAVKERKSTGKVLSDFFRRALETGQRVAEGGNHQTSENRNGVPVVPSRGEIVTAEHIRRIREQEGI